MVVVNSGTRAGNPSTCLPDSIKIDGEVVRYGRGPSNSYCDGLENTPRKLSCKFRDILENPMAISELFLKFVLPLFLHTSLNRNRHLSGTIPL